MPDGGLMDHFWVPFVSLILQNQLIRKGAYFCPFCSQDSRHCVQESLASVLFVLDPDKLFFEVWFGSIKSS